MFLEFAKPTVEKSSAASPDKHWKRHIHPGGWIYYGHRRDRVVTTVNTYDPVEYQKLQSRYRDVDPKSFTFPDDDEYRKYQSDFNRTWELLIDHDNYQWIDHKHAVAGRFNQNLSDFLNAVKAYEGRFELAFEMRERYWRFLQNHPCDHQLPPGSRRHIYDVLMWCKADQTLFSTSTSSFTTDQAKDLLDISRELSDPETRLAEENGIYYASSLEVWFTAAVAATIAADRIALGYATPQARSLRNLEKRSEVADFSHPHFRATPYIIFFAISFALFFSIPTSCLRQIIDVDRRRFEGGGINETRWRRFLQSQLKGWSDSNLLATVMIAATVAFIAVPGIDNASRSITLLSALLSIGSVLMGQYHIRIHEPRSSSTAQTGLDYLQNVGSSPILAIFLSLPLIFISWAFVLFVVAFIVYAVRGNDGDSNALPLSTKLIVTIAAGTLALLMAAIIFLFRAAWNPTQPSPLLQVTNIIQGQLDDAPDKPIDVEPETSSKTKNPNQASTLPSHYIPTSAHPRSRIEPGPEHPQPPAIPEANAAQEEEEEIERLRDPDEEWQNTIDRLNSRPNRNPPTPPTRTRRIRALFDDEDEDNIPNARPARSHGQTERASRYQSVRGYRGDPDEIDAPEGRSEESSVKGVETH